MVLGGEPSARVLPGHSPAQHPRRAGRFRRDTPVGRQLIRNHPPDRPEPDAMALEPSRGAGAHRLHLAFWAAMATIFIAILVLTVTGYHRLLESKFAFLMRGMDR
jgi:hypothetical protein